MIIFYDKETKEEIDDPYDIYFIRGDGTVWCDNANTWESSPSVIGFDDCISPCPNISWRST